MNSGENKPYSERKKNERKRNAEQERNAGRGIG